MAYTCTCACVADMLPLLGPVVIRVCFLLACSVTSSIPPLTLNGFALQIWSCPSGTNWNHYSVLIGAIQLIIMIGLNHTPPVVRRSVRADMSSLVLLLWVLVIGMQHGYL